MGREAEELLKRVKNAYNCDDRKSQIGDMQKFVHNPDLIDTDELDQWYENQKRKLDYRMSHCDGGSSIPDKYIIRGGDMDDKQ